MKKFLIMGSINAYAWKEIFPLVKFNKMDVGYLFNKTLTFTIPGSDEKKKICGICWYQSLKKNIDRKEIEFTKQYNPVDYPKYDNYDAIEVSKSKNIPMDYTGLMGVPISFIYKLNPNRFELVDVWCSKKLYLNEKALYARLIIRRKV